MPPALHEYSVVFNDRALNHMSSEFHQVMRDISATLKSVYGGAAVAVLHTREDGWHSGRDFQRLGLQTAAGVPLMCGEPPDFKTFRVGLFGLDKLYHIDRTVDRLARALSQLEIPHAR